MCGHIVFSLPDVSGPAISFAAIAGSVIDVDYVFYLPVYACLGRSRIFIIACSKDPQFRKLFQDISFDPAASARALETQLTAAANQ